MLAIQVPVNGNEQVKSSYRNHKLSDAICFEQKMTLFHFSNLNFRTQ